MTRRTIQSALYGVARMAALSMLALAACERPTEVLPSSRAAPPDIMPTLTGAVGTPIFPAVLPGRNLIIGDARGLNSTGQVTGTEINLTSDIDYDAYRFTPGVGIDAIRVCCDTRIGADINDAGTVVGAAQQGEGGRGFVASATSTMILPALPGVLPYQGARAVAINNAGTVAGWSEIPSFTRHAVLWSSSGVIQDLGMPNTEAVDINASGQVLISSTSGAAPFFLWNPGGATQNLNTLLGALTSVVELNDAGQITGTFTTSGGASHAFLYTPGSGLTDLGTLGGATSAPTGLNNKGDVVGTSLTSGGVAHAFLWTKAEGMEDVTATSGVNDIGRLNDNLQTVSVYRSPRGFLSAPGQPRLIQLQVTQSNAPPTAVFTVSCNGLTCTLDASTSLDDKPGLTYAWDLGKLPEGTATGEVVKVTYPHESSRTVTLTVTDAQGLTSSSSQTFSVTEFPIAAFTYACSGLTCSFDASGSTSGDLGMLEFIYTFGDGAVGTGGPVRSHTYAQPGTYHVTLQVGAGIPLRRAFLTQEVTVTAPTQNQPPVADFTWSCNGTICTLDASASADDAGIASYDWSLGKAPDGSATGVKVVTDYWHNGARTVTLAVTDVGGLSSSITKSFEVGAPPVDAAPVARFTWSCNGTVCTMDASTSTDDVGIVSYDWSLGKAPDGTASGVKVSTDYWHSSTRSVTLTVTDTKGQSNSVTQMVTVP